ncbi:MAG: hypothetical protein HY846_04120, partial [Nitrosomonadales bacterium]|nr:hypothetical protein [Nitrosomonadales bacterium]
MEQRVLLAGDALLVSGAIDVPGETDSYSFNLTQDRQVYLDSLSDVNFTWSLSGPRGAVVANRSLQGTDSSDMSGNPVMNLVAGEYRVTVDAPADATGAYQFQLVDLTTATTITPGVPTAGSLNPGNETDIYQFSANAGDRFYFDSQQYGTSDATWRLIDPTGNQIFRTAISSDVDVTALPYTGNYTLMIEGRRYSTAANNYQFNVQPVTDDTALLALGSTVNGAIAHTGQRDFYTFSLAADAVAYFDSQTSNGNFNWTLTGPRGTVVAARSFTGSDSYELGGSPVLSLAAGDYTLMVDATGQNTGDYAFRLTDLSAATGIVVGDTVTGNLAPGSETDIYRFTASARDQVLFDQLSASRGGASWRLINPYAGLVFGPSNFADIGPTVLPYAGIYYLLVEGRYNETLPLDYSFRIQDINLPNPGGYIAQDFDVAGLPYAPATFSAAVPAVVPGGPSGSFLRLLPGSVTGTNTVGFTNTSPGVIPASVTVDFDFRITRVSNQGDGIGFAWLNADTWGNSGPAPQFGEEPNLANSFGVGFDPVNNGEINDNHLSLHFNGSRLADYNLTTLISGFRLDSGSFHHARIFMQAVAGGSQVSVYLTPQGGSEVAVVQNYFINSMQAYDGRMAFGARNGGWRADNDIDNVNVAVVPGTDSLLPPAITLGNTVAGSLATTAEIDRFRLILADNRTICFDNLNTNYSLCQWSLVGPQGTVSAGRTIGASDSAEGAAIYTLGPGEYTFSLYSGSGSYSFRVLDLTASTQITPGTAASGTLNPANSTQAYKLDVTAGDRYYFDITARNGGDVYWRLLDPYGRTVFGPAYMNGTSYDIDVTTLAYTGAYTLLIEGRYYTTGTASYSFNVQKVSDDLAALTLGARMDGVIAHAGQVDRYTFSLASDSKLVFDALSDTAFYWTLTGPRGMVVNARNLQTSDGLDGNPLLDLVAGDYVLSVDGSAEATGAYAFRLLD